MLYCYSAVLLLNRNDCLFVFLIFWAGRGPGGGFGIVCTARVFYFILFYFLSRLESSSGMHTPVFYMPYVSSLCGPFDRTVLGERAERSSGKAPRNRWYWGDEGIAVGQQVTDEQCSADY